MAAREVGARMSPAAPGGAALDNRNGKFGAIMVRPAGVVRCGNDDAVLGGEAGLVADPRGPCALSFVAA